MAAVVAAALFASGLSAVAAPATASATDAPAAAMGAAEAPDVTRAQILAAAQHRPIEVTGLRDASSTTVVNPDGTMTTKVADAPVNVQQTDGSWKPIDTSLSVGADGRVHAGQVPFDLSLSNGGDSAAVDVTPGSGKRAKWLSDATLPSPVLAGSTARYVDVQPGVDLLASVTASGFELSYVLTRRPAAGLKLQVPLQLTGLSLGADANGDPQLSAAGKALVKGAPALMWDAATDPGKANVDKLKTVGQSLGSSSITLNPDSTFLQDPSTQYPVTIDPYYGLTFHYGTYVYQAGPNTNYDGSSYFRTGLASSGSTIQRTLLRFQIPTSLTGKHILDASLGMYVDSATSCAAQTVVRTLNSSFDPTTVTYANQPAFSGPYDATGFATGCAGTTQTIHMTDVANLWINNGQVNNGFVLTGSPETDTNTNKVFRSENYSGGAYKPTLTITYNTYPNTTAGRYMSPQNYYAPTSTMWTSSLTPTLRGAASDADGGTNFMKAEVWNNAHTSMLWSGSGAVVKAGATSPVTVGSGVLANGTMYGWRAKQNDGTDDSTSYSSWLTFTVDTTAPAAPTISSSTYTANAWASTQADAPFTFSSIGHNDVASFAYRFDGGQWLSQDGNVGATNSATTFTLKNIPAGWQTLHVVAIDRAGNRSPEGTFSFGTTAGTTSPADGTATQQYVTLKAVTGLGNPYVRWKYRMKDADSWTDIPVGSGGAVTDTNLVPVSSWPVATTTGSLYVNSPTLILDTRKLLTSGGVTSDGTVQIQAWFNNGILDYATGNQAIVTLDQNGFGGGYATAQVGPGTVSLGSGNYALSATDASVSSYGSDLTLSRTFNSKAPTATGLMGPGWTTSVGVDAAGSGFTSLVDIGGSVTLTDTDGAKTVFANRNGHYVGQGDADSLTLTAGSNLGSAPGSFTLLDPDGNQTIFSVTSNWAQAASVAVPHNYPVTSVVQPGSSQTTSYTYNTINGVSVPVRLLAPVTPGVTCPGYPSTFTGTGNMGCRALDLTYTNTGAPQIVKATEQTTDGAGTSITVDLACFSYDGNGRLWQAWDPRLNATSCTSSPAASDLPTTYTYDGSGRLSTLTPPGLAAWTFGYDSNNRFVTAGRTHNSTWGSGTETSTVFYDVPLGNDTDATNGYHPDLSATTAATWAQTDTPVSAVAIFAPGDAVPSVPLQAGADFRDGTIHALDTNTREVNTAVYSGTGQAGWKINTSEYDANGNTLRTLDAANRDRALRRSDAPKITVDLPTDTAAAALMLDNQNLYALNPNDTTPETGSQLDLVDSFGPLHQVVLPDGTLAAARAHSHTDYDTGSEQGHPAPTNVSLHLKTTEWTEAATQTGVYTVPRGTAAGLDGRTTSYGYSLNSGTDVTGWTFRTPLTTTSTPGGTASPITTTTVLDPSTGIAKESRMPSDTAGAGAGTTTTSYYTNGTLNNANCVNNAWYMQVCKTQPKVQPGVAGLPGLPVVSTTYDWLLRPQTVTETVTDANNNPQTRSTTTTYGNSGWSPRSASTSTTSSLGTAIPTVSSSYDTNTGLLLSTSATGAGSALTNSYDDFGRPVSFTDADNAQTTSSYDSHGRVASTSEILAGVTLRTTTLSYNGGTEHRGLVTSSTTSGLGGSFTGSYDAGGNLLTETYPNGITASWTSDETGDQTSLSYAKSGTTWFTDTQQSNIFGQWRTHTGLPSSQTYSYDGTGRLTTVADTSPSSDQTTLDCTTRVYAFDGTSGTDSNRTSLTTYNAATDHTCQTATAASTVSNTYDSADRLQATGRATGLVYDAFGRITTLPAALTTVSGVGGNNVTNSFYVNDLIASQASNGFTRTWQLDASQQRSRTYTDNSSGSTITKTNHYNDASEDSPSWIDEGGTSLAQTQYSPGLDGNLAATDTRNSSTGAISGLVFNLTNLHGDLVTTATSAASIYDGVVSDNDEFGNVKTSTGTRYGWLGGKQRSTESFGNLTVMGVRLYNAVVGRFLQVDPVAGGSCNDYDYTCQDPINQTDLDGRMLPGGDGGGGSDWLTYYLHGGGSVCLHPLTGCFATPTAPRHHGSSGGHKRCSGRGASLLDCLGVHGDERWLIMAESSGNPTAQNSRSTAFGLGQFLLATRKQYLGKNYNTTDPYLQLAAFRRYVKDRYGTAARAKAFHLKHGWY